MLLSSYQLSAQVSYESNDHTANSPTGYLGWYNTNNAPLDIKQNDDNRMRFHSTNWAGYNAQGGISSMNRIIIPTSTTNWPANFTSMLHIGGPLGFGEPRPWMNVGTTYGDNGDMMYVGLLSSPGNSNNANVSDAIIAWGNNDQFSNQQGGVDNFRFLFLAHPADQLSPGAAVEGLETMRIDPNGNIGIGDFSPNGVDEQPTQRIDVDGGARIRQLPLNETPDVIITGREVDAVGDYLLTYTPFDDISSNDCRWVDVNSASIVSEQDIVTGVNPQENCYRGKVGIGIAPIKSAKLMVNSVVDRDNVPQGIHSRVLGTTGYANTQMVGVLSIARGVSSENNSLEGYYGVQAYAGQAFTAQNLSAGRDNVGVYAKAGGHTYSANTIGVYSLATKYQAGNEIALYGENTTSGNPLYLVGGPSVFSGTSIILSDESIKHDISDLEGATSLINALQPKTYYLHSPDNRPIAFDENLQYGLIAQEVQEVLPEIVRETTVPEMTDSTGFIEGTSADLLGIQYEALIPILIAGFNEQSGIVSEQQGIISEQTSQLESMEQTIESLEGLIETQTSQMEAIQSQMQEMQVQFSAIQVKTNNCCNNGSQGSQAPTQNSDSKEIKLGQNVPNPFSTTTRIDFELVEEAQIKLEITDSAGSPIQTLIDGQMSTGTHSTTWDGSSVAPGMYYYTLYADGELLTKKMIKR